MKNSNLQTFFTVVILISIVSLNLSAQQTLYGLTSNGGKDFGTVIEYNTGSSNISNMYPLQGNSGGFPMYTSCVQAPNGLLYGMTSEGGYNGDGVIFEFNTITNQYTKKFDFFNYTKGSHPYGSLYLAANGKFYGMTRNGGSNNDGVLFEYDYVSNTYTKKHDFGVSSSDGFEPEGSFVEANGKLYGVVPYWGANNKGILFEYDYLSNSYTIKYNFIDSAGSYPHNSLLLAGNGKLYGLTENGGVNGLGVIFEYDMNSNSYTKKFNFGSTNGSNPFGSLIEVNSKLYGITKYGGTQNRGVLFEYDYINNIFQKKFDFDSINGMEPMGTLMLASNGLIYGTAAGGIYNSGVLFEYDCINDVFSKKIDFQYVDGKYPKGGLMEVANKLYGLTNSGGLAGVGIIYEYDLSNFTFLKKADIGGIEGKDPEGSLMSVGNNKLYGVTSSGGLYNAGVIFEYDYSTHTYSKKFDFDKVTGEQPVGTPVHASNGKLYGLTYSGGTNGLGVLYEYDFINDIYTTKVNFNNFNGEYPKGSMIEVNGKLYGFTTYGGALLEGVLFEYDLNTGVYTKKHEFNTERPEGSLVLATNGKMYGMSVYGGTNGYGVLFEYDIIPNTYTVKYNFNQTGGIFPHGSLIQANNGKLYGMTSQGGNGGSRGVLFEFNISTGAYVKKIDFNFNNGAFPTGSLFQGSNGFLYGMTPYGGVTTGTLFEYSISSNILTNKVSFNASLTGSKPFGDLIEPGVFAGIISQNDLTTDLKILAFPNPSYGIVNLNISSEIFKSYIVNIYDVYGKLIDSKKRNADNLKFDVSTYAEGIYLFDVEGETLNGTQLVGAIVVDVCEKELK